THEMNTLPCVSFCRLTPSSCSAGFRCFPLYYAILYVMLSFSSHRPFTNLLFSKKQIFRSPISCAILRLAPNYATMQRRTCFHILLEVATHGKIQGLFYQLSRQARPEHSSEAAPSHRSSRHDRHAAGWQVHRR